MMNLVRTLRPTLDEDILYRRACTGEKLGWVLYTSEMTFAPAHRVLMHPEDGPVIIVWDEVFEVDVENCEIYATEDAAKEAYYARPK